ncbi:MAG: mannitol dehydrogenase family protein [Lachnospiraceae bacterium]|nr:mannitol dehydrogenase family protein [Lachnospiraceae bacterium]
MKLNNEGLKNTKEWEALGYDLPGFDRDAMIEKTKKAPVWIHFGAGNIFRAFQANVVQNLLNKGVIDRGLTVCEGYDYEIIEKMYAPHDDLSILATFMASGKIQKTVVGSIAESLTLDSDNTAAYDRLKEIFKSDSLQMASFTITEKGYSLVNGKGEMLPSVAEDLKNGPAKPESYLGKVVSLLYTRFLAGEKPIAFVSMDNCSHNGDKLYAAVEAFAREWEFKGLIQKGFVDYINNEKKVSFPWSMIDKITPRPDASVEAMLKADGIEDAEPIITSKNTYVAPFVNAEECEYLVIEDKFPNGRPELEKGGIMFTDRETVDKVEKMKVCTCLNPLHTSLAVFGCLLGYTLISKEMQDPVLNKMVRTIGYVEGLPVVVDPGIMSPKQFIDDVVEKRIPNPFMPDAPQRIATDTSQKLPIRFGETVKAYARRSDLSVDSLKLIPLVYAGWIRYIMAIDDKGNKFELSSDPMLPEVCPLVADIKLGDGREALDKIKPILKNSKIWGVDLYEVGLADKVAGYFLELIAGVGAVEKTLKKYVG